MRMRPHPVQQPRQPATPIIVPVVMTMHVPVLVTVFVLVIMPVPVLVMLHVALAVLMSRVVRAGIVQGVPVIHIAKDAAANK
jgi:hypothetical protein